MLHSNEWLSYLSAVRGLSALTVKTYSNSLLKFELWRSTELVGVPEHEVSAYQVSRFISACSSSGLRATTVNLHRSALLSYYSFCCTYKGYSHNPVLEVRPMKTPRLLPEYVPLDHISAVISTLSRDTFRGQRARAIITTLTQCGLRASELIGLRVSDMRDNHFVVFGKGSKQRVVPFSKQVFDELAQLETVMSRRNMRRSEFLFCREDGQPLTRSILYKIIRSSFCGSQSSHAAHPHALRHTFATICCMHGVPIPQLQALMGHSTPATTFRYISVVGSDTNPFDTF